MPSGLRPDHSVEPSGPTICPALRSVKPSGLTVIGPLGPIAGLHRCCPPPLSSTSQRRRGVVAHAPLVGAVNLSELAGCAFEWIGRCWEFEWIGWMRGSGWTGRWSRRVYDAPFLRDGPDTVRESSREARPVELWPCVHTGGTMPPLSSSRRCREFAVAESVGP